MCAQTVQRCHSGFTAGVVVHHVLSTLQLSCHCNLILGTLCHSNWVLAETKQQPHSKAIRWIQIVVHVFLQQVRVSPQELNAIVARLNTRPVKEVKTGSESSQAKAVRLFYQKDAAKGYKEVYVPIKRVWLDRIHHIMTCTQLTCMACIRPPDSKGCLY